MPAYQHEHQIELAARMEHPIDGSKHKHTQTLLIEIADVCAEKMMKGFTNTGYAVPAEVIQVIPNRMEMVLACDDFQGMPTKLSAARPMIAICLECAWQRCIE